MPYITASLSFRCAKRSKKQMENLSKSKLSRRSFVQRSLLAGAATSLLPTASQAATTPVSVPVGPNLYEEIGVRPLINAKGTYTIISGSLSLPEATPAKEEASGHYLISEVVLL